MNRKREFCFKKYAQVFVMLILLIGLNVHFIGAVNETEDIEVELVEEVLDEVTPHNDCDEVNLGEETEESDLGGDIIIMNDSETYVEVNLSEDIEDLSLNEDIIIINDSETYVEVNFSEETGNASENVSDGFEYIDIDTLLGNESLQSSELATSEEDEVIVEKEKILKELVKDGQIELEFEIFEGDDVEIMKKEVGRGELEKDVLISSDEHFDDEVRVYSDLPSPALKENIVVTWESESEVVSDIEYFDLDGDDLIDRISWVVPHLSTQHYSIVIIVDEVSGGSELDINTNVPSGIVSNPVVFEINISYVNLDDIECNLKIDGDIHILIEDGDIIPEYFKEEENHSWILECRDKNNFSISKIKSGNFVVRDSFNLSLGDFFLKSSGVSGSVNANGGVVELKLIRPDLSEVFVKNLSGNFPQDFSINSSVLGNAGVYSLKAVSHFYAEADVLNKSFNLGIVNLSFNNSGKMGSVSRFDLRSDSLVGGVYDLYVGTNRIKNNGVFGSGFGTISSTDYTPLAVGNFDVDLEVTINGILYEIDGGILNVASGIDSKDPDVTLIFPDWEDEVKSRDIEFEYRVDEDNGIKNCSFKLYNTTKDSSGVHQTDKLIFPISSSDKSLAFKNNVVNGQKVEIRLVDFDDGDYIWEVRCFDNAGNEGWDFNYFSVDVVNDSGKVLVNEAASYSRQDEVEDLIEKINSFLEKEDDFGLEERKILEVLGLSSDMTFWKKRVVQMDQDLKFNLKFMEEEKREKRTKEIYDEIDEIKGKIVLDVVSVDSYEFSKGSVDLDLVEVIGNYMEASGVDIGDGALRSLVSYNNGLQKDLGVSVETWKLELEYLDGVQEIVLVSKNLDVSGDKDLKVLEIIPDKWKAVFVSNVEDEGNGIYSVDASSLEGGNLVYYFEEGFALKEVEKMESVLFGEGSVSSGLSSITGMFIGVGDSISLGSFFWLPLFLFIGYFGFMIFGKVRLENWKKEPGVERMVELINETNGLVRDGRIDIARDNYRKMGEIYKALPVKCKGFFYRELGKVRLAIDKKDVLNLIREYEAAKDSFRKDDAVMLHGKINAIYRKLPKNFQEKVYRRLVKKEV